MQFTTETFSALVFSTQLHTYRDVFILLLILPILLSSNSLKIHQLPYSGKHWQEKTLENFELMANRQSFLTQIYRIFNIHIFICSSSDLSGTM